MASALRPLPCFCVLVAVLLGGASGSARALTFTLTTAEATPAGPLTTASNLALSLRVDADEGPFIVPFAPTAVTVEGRDVVVELFLDVPAPLPVPGVHFEIVPLGMLAEGTWRFVVRVNDVTLTVVDEGGGEFLVIDDTSATSGVTLLLDERRVAATDAACTELPCLGGTVVEETPAAPFAAFDESVLLSGWSSAQDSTLDAELVRAQMDAVSSTDGTNGGGGRSTFLVTFALLSPKPWSLTGSLAFDAPVAGNGVTRVALREVVDSRFDVPVFSAELDQPLSQLALGESGTLPAGVYQLLVESEACCAVADADWDVSFSLGSPPPELPALPAWALAVVLGSLAAVATRAR